MDWNQIYEDFPINKNLIWLNNCGTTSASIQVKHAINAYLEDFLAKGVFQTAFPLLIVRKKIQDILGRLLNCKSEEIALIHNTNEGMMYLSGGLSLRSGDEILLLTDEYPSNVYPWERWKESGVNIRFIPLAKDPLSQLEAIKMSITEKTKVLSLSAVHWCTGMPLPLEETGKLCNEKKILFFVDGAQGVGHIKIDFEKTNADALSFSCWKWLLGPLGLGVLVLKNSSAQKLLFPFKGCDSVAEDMKYLPYQEKIKSGAARYMTSTAPYIEWIYFCTILEYLEKIGFEKISDRIFSLAKILEDGLTKLKFTVLSQNYAPLRTGIVCSHHPSLSTSVLVEGLKNRGIVARERSGNLRLAPHVYQTEEQMVRVLKALEDIVKSQS